MVYLPVRVVLTGREKNVKVGLKGWGSAGARFRGMGRGSAGAWFRGRGSAVARLRGMGRGSAGARFKGCPWL